MTIALIIVVILIFPLVLLLLAMKQTSDQAKKKMESLPNADGIFELLTAREYDHSEYFSYKVNRKYKKLADRLDVAGISRHKDDADSFYYSKKRSLALEREKDNPKDPNAIKVLGNGCDLGYVPKDVARQIAQIMDKEIAVFARLEGLGEPGNGHNTRVVFSLWAEKEKMNLNNVPGIGAVESEASV